MAVPLIRASFWTGFAEYLQARGVSVDATLEAAGLELEQLQNPANFIRFDNHMLLMEVLAERLNNDAVMLELVEMQQDIDLFGALGVLAASSENVGAALMIFDRYLNYSVQGLQVSLQLEGETAFFLSDTDYPPVRGYTQIWTHALAWMCQMVRILTGESWSPRAVYFHREEPRDLRAYKKFFRAPLVFGNEKNGITFASEVLARPVAPSLAAVPQRLSRALQENFADDLPAQVDEVIRSLLVTGQCNAATVASTMGYKLRTMQRKL